MFVTVGKEIEIEIPTKVDFCPSFDWFQSVMRSLKFLTNGHFEWIIVTNQ